MGHAFTIPDTVATSDPRPPARSADGHRLAILRPAHQKQLPETVELLARVGKGMVKVRSIPRVQRDGTIPKPGIWAVYPFRLVDAVTKRQLLRADLTSLPWQGAGEDPDLKEERK